jgi:hypothetical protein
MGSNALNLIPPPARAISLTAEQLHGLQTLGMGLKNPSRQSVPSVTLRNVVSPFSAMKGGKPRAVASALSKSSVRIRGGDSPDAKLYFMSN